MQLDETKVEDFVQNKVKQYGLSPGEHHTMVKHDGGNITLWGYFSLPEIGAVIRRGDRE